MTGTEIVGDPGSRAERGGAGGGRRKRRGTKIAAAVFVLATGGAVTAVTLDLGGGPSGDAAASELPPKTAAVVKQTLKDTRSKDGKLGYGSTATASSRLPGTLTGLPAEGERISRGESLYEVDTKPVILLYGSKPAYRALAPGAEGPDVKQLERNLAALGHTGFTVDEEYSDLTAKAVKKWQEDRGLPETGKVELGRVVFTPGAIRVESLDAAKGDMAAPGQKVLTYTGTAQAVTMKLDPADRQLASKGTDVTVRLPDGKAVRGTISEVSTMIQPGSGEEATTTKIEAVVRLRGAKVQKAVGAYEQAAVHVDFTADTREDVLTVPVAALLALSEGGFGVEVVKGTTTTYVPVTTGLFAKGRVEISGDGISEGTKVGVPK